MTVKDSVLLLLYKSKGGFVSGEKIANTLSVSRTAVWKAVNLLRKEGHLIEAEPNRGYFFDGVKDILSAPAIMCYLNDSAGGIRIEKHESVKSTNSAVHDKAVAGEPEGLVVAAEQQTKGRGRRGREFFSPNGTGLYFSVLLRPVCSVADSSVLTAAAASAAAKAIEKVSGRETCIKWVNDVYIDGKKVCGILTEAAIALENTHLEYAIVGIGVNVFEPEGGYPPELCDVATSMFKSGEAKGDVRAGLAAEILNNLFDYYKNLEQRTFFDDYKKRSFVIGKDITVMGAHESRSAHAVDIDADCRLVVRYDDGSQEALAGGEISIRL